MSEGLNGVSSQPSSTLKIDLSNLIISSGLHGIVSPKKSVIKLKKPVPMFSKTLFLDFTT